MNQTLAALLLALAYLPSATTVVAAPAEAPDEVVVVGRQPGPPLWRVSHGDNVLWIFPTLSPLPKDMTWDSERVARVIAQSQEYIGMPNAEADTSALLLVNPINWVRGYRLAKRLMRNPDGAELDEVLPPDLYARFTAQQERYFPREKDLDELRPLVVGDRMTSLVHEAVGLGFDPGIADTIRKLTRRNRGMKRTEVSIEIDLKGSFGELADRAETLMASFSREQELACFEQRLRALEEDLDDKKSRANAWAQGYIDEFRHIPLVGDETDACSQLVYGSSEQDLILDVEARLRQQWLEAVDAALAANASTFAVLPINDLLRADGYISALKERGYVVREP